jgi:hypothetical protein
MDFEKSIRLLVLPILYTYSTQLKKFIDYEKGITFSSSISCNCILN